MNPDTLWLVRLGIDQGLFTRAQAVTVKVRLAGRANMLEFAQKLIDEEVVTNVEALEQQVRDLARRNRVLEAELAATRGGR